MRVRLGFMPLVDCAVLAVAETKGFFRQHDLDVVLTREPSWATLRDKLAADALDGAHLLAGMPLASAVGIDPVAAPTITAFSLSLNGNAISVSRELWARMAAADAPAMAQRPTTAAALRAVIDADRQAGRPPLRLAMVYPFATHNYELRYWLAAAGIDPDVDVRLSVVPPPFMVEALARGAIDGFCVGEPWSSLAVHEGLARIVVSSYELWNNSPEKVLAVQQRFAEASPDVHRALLRALLEAAAWTDAAEHRGEVAQILADPRYVGAPLALLAGSLTGHLVVAPDGAAVQLDDFHVFHRYTANFPWVSHAAWLLTQMQRWGQLREAIDVLATARRVYRPDLYRQAARDLGMGAPDVDVKREGAHDTPWTLTTANAVVRLGSDRFFDGRVFDPNAIDAYVSDDAR
jgi:two-component system, oxyanion-binding sensor